MKKILYLVNMLLILGFTTMAQATELWSGNEAINWSAVSIDKNKLSELSVGDVVHVEVTDIAEGATANNYKAQVSIRDGYWTEIEEDFILAEGDAEATFTLTGDMLALMKSRGMVITGKGYTATHIYTEPSGYTGSEKSIWVGNRSGENYSIPIHFNHFKIANNGVGIAAGDIIRLTFTAGEESWLMLQYTGSDTGWSWKEFDDAVVTHTATGADVVVTESMVSILKKNNFIVHPNNCNMTQVEIIPQGSDPGEVTELWSGNKPISWADNVVISANQLSSLGIGDVLHVEVTDIPAGATADNWKAQVSIRDGDGKEIERDFILAEGATEATFVLAGDVIKRIKAKGMIVMGHDFTATHIYSEAGKYTGTRKSIWLGNLSGNFNTTISPIHFQNANNGAGIAADDIIRFTYIAADKGTLSLKYNGEDTGWSWTEFVDVTITKTETGADVTVTEAMATILNKDNCIVQGDKIRLTQVEIITKAGDVTELWSGNEAIAWNGVSIEADKLSTLNIGDVLHVEVTNIAAGATVGNWKSQVSIRDGGWVEMEDNVPLAEGDTEATFVLTGDIMTLIKAHGLVITGDGYTATRVYAEPSGLTGSENSIWIGDLYGKDYIFPIHFNHFKIANNGKGIAAGDIIRMTFTSSEGNWLLLHYRGESTDGAWKEFEDAVITRTDTGADVLVTASMATILTKNQLIVHPNYCNMTQVEIIPKSPSPGDPEPYAALSGDDEMTLTFYYDGNKAIRSGMDVGPFTFEDYVGVNSGWYAKSEKIKTVVFDESFANYDGLTSTAYWFYNCLWLTTITGIKYLNTVNVTDMSYMFAGCPELTTLDVSKFNTANVTDMSCMFGVCSKLTSLDVSKFNTAKVTSMERMFSQCSSLTSLDVSGFNTENVTRMDNMFEMCSGLKSLDVSKFNTAKVTRMDLMFNQCSSLTTLDVSNFNVAKVTNMNAMFCNCPKLTTIYCNDSWSCESSLSMFYGCTSLKGAISYDADKTDVTYANPTTGYFTEFKEPYAVLSGDEEMTLTFYYDGNKESRGGMSVGPFNNYKNVKWYSQRGSITTVVFDNTFADCTTLTSTAYWFLGCGNLTTITGISNLKTDNVTDMESMFNSCLGLTSLDVSNFNTANVTNMRSMFYKCSALTSLDVSKFNTTNVTNMSGMFNSCSGLSSLDLSKFNTTNVTDMNSMFISCSGLTSLDVSNFNTENVTDMGCMFCSCSSLTSLDVSKFNTANVTDMFYMFYKCEALTSLDVSKFNTANVTNMGGMFYNCKALTSLDVSKFNTANVTDMSQMFRFCSSLTTIYCNDAWTCATSNDMFSNCTSLKGAISYDADKTDVTYANPTTGYFTKKNAAFIKGDANGDGVVNLADAVAIWNYITGTPAGNFNIDAADVNDDSKITITDAVGVVDIIANASAISATTYYGIDALADFDASTDENPMLFIDSDVDETIVITRADGVIDLMGHSVNEFYLQNNEEGKAITLRNGIVNGNLDGKNEWNDWYKGTVILENMTVNNQVYTDGHAYVFIGGNYNGSIENYKTDGTPGTVVIRGGRFKEAFNTSGNWYETHYGGATFTLYGGKFKIRPKDEWCADGYTIQDNTGDDKDTYPYFVVLE